MWCIDGLQEGLRLARSSGQRQSHPKEVGESVAATVYRVRGFNPMTIRRIVALSLLCSLLVVPALPSRK
jgi:hypothetical protein